MSKYTEENVAEKVWLYIVLTVPMMVSCVAFVVSATTACGVRWALRRHGTAGRMRARGKIVAAVSKVFPKMF